MQYFRYFDMKKIIGPPSTTDFETSASDSTTSTTIDLEAFAWTYSQTSGELDQDGNKVATGYSGAGIGKNNPVMQNVHNVGPIPQGDVDRHRSAGRYENARALRAQTHPQRRNRNLRPRRLPDARRFQRSSGHGIARLHHRVEASSRTGLEQRGPRPESHRGRESDKEEEKM